MLWASKSCYSKFCFKQLLCGEEHQYTTNPFLFFLKKTKPIKQKIFNINYLIMLLIKMRLLIFLVLSRYGLAYKYRIISQISIYNVMHNCIFWYFWYRIFIFFTSNYDSQAWLVTYRLAATSQMVCHMMSWEQYHLLR